MKFNIGDRVKIRQWDDMASEFGVDNDGDIMIIESFVTNMAHLCGRTATITKKIDDRVVELDYDDKSGDLAWEISIDMIEKIN